jgi:hypothetical protein
LGGQREVILVLWIKNDGVNGGGILYLFIFLSDNTRRNCIGIVGGDWRARGNGGFRGGGGFRISLGLLDWLRRRDGG